MRRILCLYALLLGAAIPLVAQNQDAASDHIYVVGNKAQPVAWNHERTLAAAILAAQPTGTVIIPSTYTGTDCNPLSTCNPGNVCVIDWRIGGTGTGNCNSGVVTQGLLDPGGNGIVFRSGLNTTRVSASADVIALFTGCSGILYLGADGNCHAAAGAPVSSVFGRTGAVTAQSGDYTWDLIGAGSNLFAQSMGTGGSLSPLNLGQVAGSQTWARPGIVAPVLATGAGGSLPNAHGIHVVVTYNTSLGETLPSIEATIVTLAGSSAITVTAPTLPAGYTGYTVYDYDANSGGPTTWQKQTSTPNCVNIVTNCVITNSNVATSGVPTSISAWVPPPNVQATNGPLGWIPTLYFPKTDGNYYPWLGVEVNSCDAVNGPPLPCGTPMFTHRTWFADNPANTPVGGRNAFVVIDHTAGIGTVLTNQDRSLWVNNQNPTTDVSQHYSITGIQTEVDVQGAPTWQAAVDSETASGSFQLQDTTTNNPGTPSGGNQVIRASYFARPTGVGLTSAIGVLGSMSALRPSGSWSAGTTFDAFRATWGTGGFPSANLQGIGYRCAMPTTANKFGTSNVCFFIPSVAMTIGSGDFLIRNDFVGLPSLLNGLTVLSGLTNSAPSAAMPINAAVNVQASVTVSQGTIPGAASSPCTGGAASYSYAFVGVDNNGGTVSSGNFNTPSTCVNPLTSGNPVTLNTTNNATTAAQYAQFVRIDVYRTAGPMATGKIGSLTCLAAAGTVGPTCAVFSDTGLAATTAVPTVNTTGGIAAAGYVQEQMNTVRVGSSGFTTAANTSLQTITGLSWNLDSGAKNYSFTCHIAYSQATANAAVAFGIQAATNAPTNIFAKGSIHTSTTAFTDAVLATLSTTTATSIVSATPSATATNFIADLDGSIEEPANTNGNVISVMVSTATSGDAVTVLRGSYCELF